MSRAAEEDLRQRRETLLAGGGQQAIDRQHARGKLTARERIEKLLDPGSFVETGLFIQHRCTSFGMDRKKVPGDGVVTGHGTIDGRLVFVSSQDFTVMGGTLGEMHAEKICQCQEAALKVGAPLISINDSGGARIQEGVDALNGFGRIFHNNTIASGVIPQISVIMGPCAGGAVYSPALTDFVFMVQGTGQMYITGPAVIKAVTGEEITAEALGGAAVHNKTSGCAHFSCVSEDECLAKIRELLSYLPSNNNELPPVCACSDDPNREDEKLNELVPENPARAYDMKEVVQALADSGQYLEVQQDYARNIITALIRMNGKSVGVIASQPSFMAGCLDINASDKAARFIRTCDAFNIPLLTLVDVPGFLPGKDQEYGGIIRHGAKMLYVYSEATVPMVTVILRKAYGGAYIGMCARSLGADAVYAWPGSEIAVMGAEGAANIIFSKEIRAAEDPAARRQEKIREYDEAMMNPYVSAARGYVDDVILPSQTRKYVINAFESLQGKRVNRLPKKHGNMPL